MKLQRSDLRACYMGDAMCVDEPVLRMLGRHACSTRTRAAFTAAYSLVPTQANARRHASPDRHIARITVRLIAPRQKKTCQPKQPYKNNHAQQLFSIAPCSLSPQPHVYTQQAPHDCMPTQLSPRASRRRRYRARG